MFCSKTKRNRKIEINHNLNSHKNKARELLTSEEGLYHRSQRPIEPEAVFGQGKSNKAYNRFRHFGKDLILMDYAIFATSFNLGKLCNKRQAMSKNGQNPPFCSQPACLLVFFAKKYQPDDCSVIFPEAQCKIAA